MILSLLIFFTSILISKLSQLQQEIATVYQLSAPYDVIHHREVLPSAQSPSLALHAISSVIKSMVFTQSTCLLVFHGFNVCPVVCSTLDTIIRSKRRPTQRLGLTHGLLC